jgi:hypothetical protein
MALDPVPRAPEHLTDRVGQEVVLGDQEDQPAR